MGKARKQPSDDIQGEQTDQYGCCNDSKIADNLRKMEIMILDDNAGQSGRDRGMKAKDEKSVVPKS